MECGGKGETGNKEEKMLEREKPGEPCRTKVRQEQSVWKYISVNGRSLLLTSCVIYIVMVLTSRIPTTHSLHNPM